MYHQFAGWFHLLSAPEDYAEEAKFYFDLAATELGHEPTSWLELGAGAGCNASHYTPWVNGEVVLTDRSTEMLALSQTINPGIPHMAGDMTQLRLGRLFEVVFTHDAASYLVTAEEVRKLAETAFAHCAPGGVAIFCPDHTAENLVFETDHGGHDGDGRAMRYLEWTTPGRPGTHEYVVDYAYIYHEDGKTPRVELDRHINGALPRQIWLDALLSAGFSSARGTPLVHSEIEPGYSELFVATRSR
jgi:hypothetical protein